MTPLRQLATTLLSLPLLKFLSRAKVEAKAAAFQSPARARYWNRLIRLRMLRATSKGIYRVEAKAARGNQACQHALHRRAGGTTHFVRNGVRSTGIGVWP